MFIKNWIRHCQDLLVLMGNLFVSLTKFPFTLSSLQELKDGKEVLQK